jgi:ribosomal protein L12E/L44/L45/RPP1/RPP2
MDLLNKDIRKEALIAVLETATTNISSDSNRADVLVSIIASKNYDKSIASLVEIAANKISSDSEKQRVLSELK